MTDFLNLILGPLQDVFMKFRDFLPNLLAMLVILLLGILLGGAISILLVLGLFVTGQYKQKAWMVFIPYGPYFLLSAFMLIYLPTWIKVVVPK